MNRTPIPPAMVTTIRNGIFAFALIVSSVSIAAAQVPAAPASLTATGTPAQVELSWPAVAGATGYRVSRGIGSGIYGQFFDVGAVTSYADTAVTNATPYFYVVAAKNALGTGANSVQASATPGTYTGAPFLIAPAHNSKPVLGMSFEWSDPSIYTSYSFILIDRTTDLVVYSTTLNATTEACTSGITCVFSPGMTGYPSAAILDTRALKWTVLGNGTWASGGEGSYNHIDPSLPEVSAITAKWTGNTVSVSWPVVPGASTYHASFMNWAHVTSSEKFNPISVCDSAVCTAKAEVSQIPFGTVHVRVRVCGINGNCTDGITSDAYKTCPAAMPTPALITPSEGSMVNGLTTVRWAETTTAERYSIQLQKDEGGSRMTAIKDDLLWRSQVTCKKQGNGLLCSRTYALSNGNYLASIRAQCGGTWGPPENARFNVNTLSVSVASISPPIWSPANGAMTSIQPVIVWSKIPDIRNYELVVTDSGGMSSTFSVVCETAICAFDYATEGMKIQGAYSFAVRIKDSGMPLSVARSFTTSTGYVPPAATQTHPYPMQEIGSANIISVHYEVDPQVPFSSVAIAGPSGFTYTSPTVARSSCPLAKSSSSVIQRCSITSGPLGAAGQYTSTVKIGTLNTMSGTGSTYWAGPPIVTSSDPAIGGARAIYSVFAQNTQFLPAAPRSPAPKLVKLGQGGGASSAWGLSDQQRAGRLHDYVSSKHFDVVVLSELFVKEAQEELAKIMGSNYAVSSSLLGGPYPYFLSKIQTNGIEFPDQDSGLAIFSQFAPEYVNPGATSNWRGTSDTLNELEDIPTAVSPKSQRLASFKANDYMWWREYGACEGWNADCLTPKGFAGIRLKNPKTGVPLFIGWTHAQSMTDNITDAYEALFHQVHNEAAPVVALMLAGAPPDYDALILGDWNLNMPASVGRHPKYHGLGSNDQDPGGGDLSALYHVNTVDDPERVIDTKTNPRFGAWLPDPPAAVGEPASGRPKTLYQQYRLAFDPRNPKRPFPEFYDLWLENPVGDRGLTYDVVRRTHIACIERDREPCGQRQTGNQDLDSFDTGSRYDSVLARFSKSNIPNAPGTGHYPNAPTGPTFNWEAGSCVQHVSLARDYLYSDHFGTIIEVGPAAPQCNPATAKADPHLWRVPNSPPLPDPNKHGYDKEAGVHNGFFKHGGANEWFFIKDPGAFDIINEGTDGTMKGIIVEAFLANDISDPIAIADATQHVDGFLPGSPGCNKEVNDASISNPDPVTGGVIAEACAGSDTRVTYRVPQGGLYVRIVPADPVRPGKRCETCTGNYHMRFRVRTCKVPHEAVVVASGIINDVRNTTEKGWFGKDQPQCWFQVEVQAPTSASDYQSLRIVNIGSGSNQGCLDKASSGGSCSTNYQGNIYKSKADAIKDDDVMQKFVQAATIPPSVSENVFSVDGAWELKVEPDTGRKAYYVKVLRDDTSRPHDAILNYDTNLKSVVFRAVSTTDIEDDYLTTLWLPFEGTFIVNDPFNNTDEDRVRQFVNDVQIQYDDVELNVDNAGGDYFKFPDKGPDGRPIVEGSKRGFGGTWKSEDKIGTWVNYTQFTRVEVIEQDEFTKWDWVVNDHLLCGKEGQTRPPGGWQAARFQQLWDSIPETAKYDGVRFKNADFFYNDICGGDEGLVTWEYKFRAGVYRPQ